MAVKEFKAVSAVGKQLVARVYYNATANNANRFLEAVRAVLPHPLLSVRVDGGSEFMAEFEQACQDLDRTEGTLTPLRAAAPQATVERLCGAGQRQHPRRVLDPLRRRLHGRRRQQRAGRLPELP